MSNFKVGDLVRLKSGSPKLVVTRTFNDASAVAAITVAWIAYGSNVPYEMSYPPEALRHDRETQ